VTLGVFSDVIKGKNKALAVQAVRVPEVRDSEDFQTIGTWKWLGCQPYAPTAVIWYSFRLEAELIPELQCCWED
jgi:hypothetical protein